jgi:hypothetical protein
MTKKNPDAGAFPLVLTIMFETTLCLSVRMLAVMGQLRKQPNPDQHEYNNGRTRRQDRAHRISDA